MRYILIFILLNKLLYAATIFTADDLNINTIKNTAGLATGTVDFDYVGSTLTMTNSHENSNNSGFASFQSISQLLGASVTDSDVVTLNLTANISSGTLASNEFEFGLSSNNTDFRSANSLILKLDNGVMSYITTPPAGATNSTGDADTAITAALDNGLDFNLEFVLDSSGYTVNFSDTTTKVGTLTGTFNSATDFTTFVNDSYFYTTAQKNANAMVVNYTEASIDVSSVSTAPAQIAAAQQAAQQASANALTAAAAIQATADTANSQLATISKQLADANQLVAAGGVGLAVNTSAQVAIQAAYNDAVAHANAAANAAVNANAFAAAAETAYNTAAAITGTTPTDVTNAQAEQATAELNELAIAGTPTTTATAAEAGLVHSVSTSTIQYATLLDAIDMVGFNNSLDEVSTTQFALREISTLVINGSHHRTLMDSAGEGNEGWHSWSTGDYAQHSELDSTTFLGEVGASYGFDTESIRLGFGLGYTAVNQDLSYAGSNSSDTEYLIIEFDVLIPDTSMEFSILGMYAMTKSEIERKYTSILGGVNTSTGKTDTQTMAVRFRIDWRDFYENDGVTITPRISYTTIDSDTDGYTETGGSTPASYDAISARDGEWRIGVDIDFKLTRNTEVRFLLEGVKRDYDDVTLTGSSALGSFTGSTPELEDTWGRAGIEFSIFDNYQTLSLALFGSTEGADNTVSSSLSYNSAF